MTQSHKLRVLHLEDDSLDAELVRRGIDETNIPCVVHRVQTRDEFRSMLITGGFDVILSDNSVHDIDGVEALALVRMTDPGIPFIFVSGRDYSSDDKKQLRELGATDVVAKSDLSELKAWLSGVANRDDRRRRRPQQNVISASQPSLANAILSITRAHSVDDACEKILRSARHITGADRVFLVRRVQDATVVRSIVGSEIIIASRANEISPQLLALVAMAADTTVALENVGVRPAWIKSEAEYTAQKEFYMGEGVASVIAVPIGGDQMTAALEWNWNRQHSMTASETLLLEALASMSATVLKNLEVQGQITAIGGSAEREKSAIYDRLNGMAKAISHDMHAPLRHLEGFTLMLRREAEDTLSDRGKHYLERIEAASQRLTRMTEQVISLLRWELHSVQFQQTDLTNLAKDIVEKLRRNSPQHSVRVEIAPDMMVHGDSRMMRAILQELISNAWKFTSGRASAAIEIGHASMNGASVYFVRDNGVGFPHEYSEKMFRLFGRLHTEAEFPGIGAGLAMVRVLLEKQGGRIWAIGEPEQGACFYFAFGDSA